MTCLGAAPRRVDLSGLAALPPTPGDRWRGLCRASGLDITALPVERRLRRAVLQPETLPCALTGRDLYAMGLRGGDIGAARQALERHILQYPEENQRKILQNKNSTRKNIRRNSRFNILI